MKIDHIAIAVPDLEAAIKRFMNDLGLEHTDTQAVPEAQTNTAFFTANAHHIELISPINQSGPVQKFLDKRKGGLHHICFQTEDLTKTHQTLKSKGYRFVDDTPGTGAHNSKVLWIHPSSTDGLLIELVEYT